ncbi:hypothetical protein KOI35_22175 [Actinoplanes bogorensis]|uniref:Lipoprotein n=1 Tax=Paractinoplanes bogorensis TaxID=1610840 RepID=A0ABS5YRY8_9ACTN|nr:hypothetical protein [Actinoplanes bogorensis]MBU2666212.1 hypothetical protein [Actinoplanes bogorensis]
MIARRIATAVATLLALAGAGACGSAPAPAGDARRLEPAAIAPGAPAARPVARAVVAAAPGVRNMPAALRLPPGSQVTGLSDRESGASFTLTAPDSAAVLAFFRSELPRGFTIVADRTDHGATSLSFRDSGAWAGTIFATAQRVTVAVRRV